MSGEPVEGAWGRRAGGGRSLGVHRGPGGGPSANCAPGKEEGPLPGARGPFLGREKALEKAREASWRLGVEVSECLASIFRSLTARRRASLWEEAVGW